MNEILIVEDETIVSLEIQSIVKDMGFTSVSRVRTKKDALTFLAKHTLDMILLDINLEGEFEGVDIARYIQMHSPRTSIIFLTAYDDEILLNAISEIHFCAYLIKPFRKSELEVILNLERLKKQKNISNITTLTPEYEFDSLKHLVIYKDEVIILTKKESLFLQAIATKHDYMVSYSKIELEVWGETEVSENTRRNLVYKLNKKLPKPLVKTHKEIGYSLQK